MTVAGRDQRSFNDSNFSRRFVHLLLRFEPEKQPEEQLIEAVHQYLTSKLPIGGTLRIFCISHRFNTQKPETLYPSVLISQTFQKPLQNCDAALQISIIEGNNVEFKIADKQLLSIKTKLYTQYFLSSITDNKTDSTALSTTGILQKTENILSGLGLTVADNVHRTWFYIDDIFNTYDDFTEARKAYFAEIGLVPETHYIASTGISSHSPEKTPVVMDCVAYSGENINIEYLKAPAHLNPTIEYGVTFERGVCLTLQKSKHIYISGTASIDAHGNVLHLNDVRAQTRRTFENIRALISLAGCNLNNVLQAVVYIRDEADFYAVQQEIDRIAPEFPAIYTLANVCRRDWLVEIECLLMVPQ